MKQSRTLRVLAAAGLGAAGVFGGHVLTYALVVQQHRHPLLIDVAHGYLPFAGLAVAVAGFMALLAGIGSGYIGQGSLAPCVASVARRLASVQAGAFVALELLERLAVGAPLSDLRGPLLVVGAIVQVVIAIVAALLLAGLRRLGEAAAGTRRTRSSPIFRRFRIPASSPRPRPLPTSIAVRAPPHARVA